MIGNIDSKIINIKIISYPILENHSVVRKIGGILFNE